jgi:hypothetical protein
MGFKEFMEIFGKEIYGWFLPDGKFIEVSLFQHFEEIGKNPDLKKYIPWYESAKERLDDLHQASLDRIEIDEHPEWHSYESAQHDVRAEMIKTNFIRKWSIACRYSEWNNVFSRYSTSNSKQLSCGSTICSKS